MEREKTLDGGDDETTIVGDEMMREDDETTMVGGEDTEPEMVEKSPKRARLEEVR